MEKYRGDTYVFPFFLEDEGGNTQSFQKGDIVRFGVKANIYTNDYALYKEKKIETDLEEIQFEFTPEETSQLEVRKYITELELERNGQVDTIYQEMLTVKGDVNRYEPKTDSDIKETT